MDWGLVEVSRDRGIYALAVPVFPLRSLEDHATGVSPPWFYALRSNLRALRVGGDHHAAHEPRGLLHLPADHPGFVTLVAVVELLRRAQWTFLVWRTST